MPNDPNQFNNMGQMPQMQQQQVGNIPPAPPIQAPTMNMQQPNYAQQGMNQVPTNITPPKIHEIDDQEIMKGYEQAAAEVGNFSNAQFVKFLGPQGQTRWESVHPGYQASLRMRLCPPWAAGKGISLLVTSHFVFTSDYPQGASLTCTGPDTCLLCKSRQLVMNNSHSFSPDIVKKAKDFGRVRKNFYYNVILLDRYQDHFSDGSPRPFILATGITLHSDIGHYLMNREGRTMAFINLQSSRAIVITKKKTGPQKMDVEYKILDEDPTPFPPQFYPMLENLWDLDTFMEPPQEDYAMKIVSGLGLPLPGQMPQQVQGASFPQPQTPSQYGQVPPSPYMPQAQNTFTNYDNPGSIPGNNIMPNMAMPEQKPPVMMTPNVATQNNYAPQSQMASKQQPPQQQAPQQQAPQQQPPQQQPPQQQAPQQQAPQQQAPQQQPPQQQPPQQQPQQQSVFNIPAPPGAGVAPIATVDGHDKCFGKYNDTDQMCSKCSGDLQAKCKQAAGYVEKTQAIDPKLAELQNKLTMQNPNG